MNKYRSRDMTVNDYYEPVRLLKLLCLFHTINNTQRSPRGRSRASEGRPQVVLLLGSHLCPVWSLRVELQTERRDRRWDDGAECDRLRHLSGQGNFICVTPFNRKTEQSALQKT